MKISDRVLMQMNSSAEYSQPCKTDIVNMLPPLPFILALTLAYGSCMCSERQTPLLP